MPKDVVERNLKRATDSKQGAWRSRAARALWALGAGQAVRNWELTVFPFAGLAGV